MTRHIKKPQKNVRKKILYLKYVVSQVLENDSLHELQVENLS